MNTENNSSIRIKFLHSEEGSIFVVGCCMLILWIEAIALLWRSGHPVWSDLLKMGFTQVPAGRAAAIAYGTQANLNTALIAFLAVYYDVITLFITYPVLIFSYKNLFERRFFQKHFKQVFESAQKGMTRVTRLRRFKIMGIFLFVWFPFTMTGIIVGALLGFLLGLRAWVNMTTVILGTASAVICWVYAYEKLFGWLGNIHQGIPLSVTILIIIILMIARIIKKREGRRV